MIERGEGWTMHLGDCLAILPTIEAGSADAVVTDPPYGVNFGYATHDDSPEGYMDWCRQWFQMLREAVAGPIAISCGIANLSEWPKSDWVMCWHKPASMGRCAVGFNNWEPVLIYGKTRAGQVVDVFRACIVPDDSISGHPCPKPLAWGTGVVSRVSRVGDTILDPFSGSGTTGVAALQLGRKFIGIEIDPTYFAIAVKRLRQAEADVRNSLPFADPEPEPKQLEAFT